MPTEVIKCENCSAPIENVNGSGTYVCAYCGNTIKVSPSTSGTCSVRTKTAIDKLDYLKREIRYDILNQDLENVADNGDPKAIALVIISCTNDSLDHMAQAQEGATRYNFNNGLDYDETNYLFEELKEYFDNPKYQHHLVSSNLKAVQKKVYELLADDFKDGIDRLKGDSLYEDLDFFEKALPLVYGYLRANYINKNFTAGYRSPVCSTIITTLQDEADKLSERNNDEFRNYDALSDEFHDKILEFNPAHKRPNIYAGRLLDTVVQNSDTIINAGLRRNRFSIFSLIIILVQFIYKQFAGRPSSKAANEEEDNRYKRH